MPSLTVAPLKCEKSRKFRRITTRRTDTNYARTIGVNQIFKAPTILLRLCPECNKTIFLKQILCRQCHCYISNRERATWNRYRLEKRTSICAKTLEEEEFNPADVGVSFDFDTPVFTLSNQILPYIPALLKFLFAATLLVLFVIYLLMPVFE